MPRKIERLIKLQGCLDDVPEWGLLRGSLEVVSGGGLTLLEKSKISLRFIRALVPKLGWSQVNIT